jgi:hypothetical protein
MHHKSVLLRACAAMVLGCVAAWPVGSALAETNAVQTTEVLDIDGNGTVEALTDALLVLRYTFGLRGQTLIQGAIGNGATRTTAAQIEAYLASLTTTLPGSCSIVGSPSSSAASPVAPGTQVQLTANCPTGAQPVSYSWNTGANGASITASPQANTTYTVTPTNSTGTGTPFSVTIYAGFIAAPGSCTIAQTPNTALSPVAAGTSVALNLMCANGSAPSSCSWNNGIVSNACSVNVMAPASTTTYSATASNSGGTSALVSSAVNVTVAGQVVTNYCTGPGDEIIGVDWPAQGQSKSYAYGFKNQRFAWKIIVPTTFNPPLNVTHLGSWRMAEVPGTAVVSRDVTVSKNPCDFESGQFLHNGIGTGDTAPSIYFTANNPDGYRQTGATLNVNSGETIYINVRNQVNGNNTCPYNGCDILLDFSTPNRY